MGAISTITLGTSLTTPLDFVDFDPTNVDGPLATYHEKDVNSGVVAGFNEITLGHRLPNKQTPNAKHTVKIRVPVLETAATAASGFTPGPTVAYELTFIGQWIIPSRATLTERQLLHDFAKGMVSHTVTQSAVQDLDFPY